MSTTVLNKIESFVNRVLKLDSYTLEKLSGLAEKQIRIEVTDLEISVLITITDAGIQLSRDTDKKADVSISGKLVSLTGLVVKRDTGSNIFPKDIEIKGDVHLAQDFQAILKGMEIDWEEYASQWMGDTAARKLGNLFRANQRWILQARDSIKANISEYLRFEIELLPDKLLLDEFNNGVDSVRDDAERLQQRIIRLEKAMTRETS